FDRVGGRNGLLAALRDQMIHPVRNAPDQGDLPTSPEAVEIFDQRRRSGAQLDFADGLFLICYNVEEQRRRRSHPIGQSLRLPSVNGRSPQGRRPVQWDVKAVRREGDEWVLEEGHLPMVPNGGNGGASRKV